MYEKQSWPDIQGQKAEKASPNQELKGMYFYEAPGVHIFEEICGVNGYIVLMLAYRHVDLEDIDVSMAPRLPWKYGEEKG